MDTEHLNPYRNYSLLLETILLSERIKRVSDETKELTEHIEKILNDLREINKKDE